MNNQHAQTLGAWMDRYDSIAKQGGVKSATGDTEAENMKDPAEAGNPGKPGFPLNSMHQAFTLPENSVNQNTDTSVGSSSVFNLVNATDPAATGEGRYETPRDGIARDNAFTSPTTSLNKIAQSALSLTQGRQDSFAMPQNIKQDQGLMNKLAGYTAFMNAAEDQQRATLNDITRQYGAEVAEAFVKRASTIYNAVYGQQPAQEEQQVKQASVEEQYAALEKAASAAHMRNQVGLEDFEKAAYAQGAVDAANAAAAEDGGIPGEAGLSDEDVMTVLQQMIASGDISQEDAEAVLQVLSSDGSVGADPQQLAAELQQARDSGAISPEAAEAIAAAILQDHPELAGDAAPEGAPVPEGAPMPEGETEKMASAVLDRAAEGLYDLFN